MLISGLAALSTAVHILDRMAHFCAGPGCSDTTRNMMAACESVKIVALFPG